MKNVLKKLGVLGLIISLIIPFTTVPEVNAATASCEGGEVHLQNYLFLDVSTPEGFKNYEDGYATYGNFPYTFHAPDDKTTVKVISVTENKIDTENEMKTYWNLYGSVLYYSSARQQVNSLPDKNQLGKIFVSETNPNYATDTIILHQEWGRKGDAPETSEWPTFGVGVIPNTFQAASSAFASKMNVSIYGTTYTTSGGFGEITSSSTSLGSNGNYTNLANYFNNMIAGKNATNTKWYNESTKYNYIPLAITRQIDDDTLNASGVIFGEKVDKGYRIFTSEELSETELDEKDGILYIKDIADIKDSYDAFQNILEIEADVSKETSTTSEEFYPLVNKTVDENNGDTNDNNDVYRYYVKDSDKDEIDFLRWENYYWPFVLNVEYEVCPVSSTVTPPVEEWTVKYDGNVTNNSVANIPQSQKAAVGTDITVDSGKPSRSGYTFKKWCENKDGSGTCYDPGNKITTHKSVTLYAQWGPEGTEDNKKTGVVSYIIGFAAVGVVAGGIYLISKKKNLFKQI